MIGGVSVDFGSRVVAGSKLGFGLTGFMMTTSGVTLR